MMHYKNRMEQLKVISPGIYFLKVISANNSEVQLNK
jgi:hypothetical protein